MRSFFDEHPRFLETSSVGAWPVRLNLRHEAIIESNRTILQDARVLDLASHDGRWSMAALKAGARHVTGVEARAELIEAANENLGRYGISADRFEFNSADLNHLRWIGGDYDVVLCLGYFYHTLNHLALFELMASTGARHIVLDGMVEPGDAPTIRVYAEKISSPANGISAAGIVDGEILVGHPTKTTLAMMAKHFGYDCSFYDWDALLGSRRVEADLSRPHSAANPVGDYARGERATALATRRAKIHL